jgi:hypothetical protein
VDSGSNRAAQYDLIPMLEKAAVGFDYRTLSAQLLSG